MTDTVSFLRHGNRLVLLLLICLKLTGDLDWPWILILAPAWVRMLGLMLALAVLSLSVLLCKSRGRPLAVLEQQLTDSAPMSVRQAFAARALPRLR